jgi:MbtH protein
MSDEHRDWQDDKVKVVRNHEQVASIWPSDRENALGWYDVGVEGSKEECLKWVEENCDGNCRLIASPTQVSASEEVVRRTVGSSDDARTLEAD